MKAQRLTLFNLHIFIQGISYWHGKLYCSDLLSERQCVYIYESVTVLTSVYGM